MWEGEKTISLKTNLGSRNNEVMIGYIIMKMMLFNETKQQQQQQQNLIKFSLCL